MTANYRAISLLIIVVSCYLVFLGVSVPGKLGLQEFCLYRFWAPEPHLSLNPYWLFVCLVGALLLLACLLMVSGLRQHRLAELVTGGMLAIFLALWLFGLRGLWFGMQYERGQISAETWAVRQAAYGVPPGFGTLRVCKSAR